MRVTRFTRNFPLLGEDARLESDESICRMSGGGGSDGWGEGSEAGAVAVRMSRLSHEHVRGRLWRCSLMLMHPPYSYAAFTGMARLAKSPPHAL